MGNFNHVDTELFATVRSIVYGSLKVRLIKMFFKILTF